MTGLRVRELSAWYELADNVQQDIFWGLSFDVRPGEILGVVGPNGCGKSTLGRALLGLHLHRTGEVLINETDIRGSALASIPQGYRDSFFPWASLANNMLLLRGGIVNKRQNKRQLESLLEEFGVNLDLHLRPSKCSGGMLQQASIIRAFWTKPKLIVADEPFSALDVRVAASMRSAFRKRIQYDGICCVVILHDFESIAQVCDRVLVVKGRPYTTSEIEGYHTANLRENISIKHRGNEISASYSEMIEKLLESDAHALELS